jgi:hypothetical protein
MVGRSVEYKPGGLENDKLRAGRFVRHILTNRCQFPSKEYLEALLQSSLEHSRQGVEEGF